VPPFGGVATRRVRPDSNGFTNRSWSCVGSWIRSIRPHQPARCAGRPPKGSAFYSACSAISAWFSPCLRVSVVAFSASS